jgi:hypothetical protein
MPVIDPVPVDALPVAPDPNDRSTFDARAYPYQVALSGAYRTQINAIAAVVTNNAAEAVAAAITATAQAAASASAVGAAMWVSGTNYAANVTAWSPIDKQTYRRNVGGVSTVDPSADLAGWTRVSGGDTLPQFLIMNQGIF